MLIQHLLHPRTHCELHTLYQNNAIREGARSNGEVLDMPRGICFWRGGINLKRVAQFYGNQRRGILPIENCAIYSYSVFGSVSYVGTAAHNVMAGFAGRWARSLYLSPYPMLVNILDYGRRYMWLDSTWVTHRLIRWLYLGSTGDATFY